MPHQQLKAKHPPLRISHLTNHSVYLYLDGNERGYANDTTCGPPTCTWNFIPTNTGSNFSIGHNYFFSPQYANASFDEFVIYDRVLNLSEIREDMNRTDPTRSFNATFRVANIQTDGPYGWNCLAYNIYNTSGWAPENWTFTYTATPYVELLYPVNNSNLNLEEILLRKIAWFLKYPLDFTVPIVYTTGYEIWEIKDFKSTQRVIHVCCDA